MQIYVMIHTLTGSSVTGILHFMSQTPIAWWSKKQATAETATYSSELVTAETGVEQFIDVRTIGRDLGVPILDPSQMLRDNKSVINSSTRFHSKLHKRYNVLSFHRVRESIEADICRFHHVRSENNPADILSKYLSYNCVSKLIRPILA